MSLPITNIVKGHINEVLGLNKDFASKRLEICYKCPLYLARFGGMCNDNLYIDPETNDVSTRPLDGYVRGCGCRLLAKTTLINAKCIAEKW